MVRIIGLDLSTTRTGIALPDGSTRVLVPPFGSTQPEKRLVWIRDQIEGLASGGYGVDPPADVVVIEDVFQGVNRQTALKLAGLQWVIRVMLHDDLGIPFAIVSNSTLKRYATGKGGGPGTDKMAMVTAARRRLGYDPEAPDDNEADALWLRALGHAAYRDPIVDMPRAQTDSCVKAITWPKLRKAA